MTCDSLPVIDLFFRQTYLFFIVELASLRIVHFNVTAYPTDAWVAQQLREATPYGQTPRFLVRDRDSKYGDAFTRVAKGSHIEILKTPYRAPRANAICERFLGSVLRECLDHMLIVGESHLYRVAKEYVDFFNQARPHQGIEQRIPEETTFEEEEEQAGKILAFPVLNGPHHDYRRAACIIGTLRKKRVSGFWLALQWIHPVSSPVRALHHVLRAPNPPRACRFLSRGQ
jgi:putative transposase